MRTWKTAIILAGLCLGMASCRDNGTDPGDAGFRVTTADGGLMLFNDTGSRVHRTLIGESIVPLIDWSPSCTDANAIADGTVELVRYKDIIGYVQGEPVRVYWWHARKGDHGFLFPDSIRTVITSTR